MLRRNGDECVKRCFYIAQEWGADSASQKRNFEMKCELLSVFEYLVEEKTVEVMIVIDRPMLQVLSIDDFP